MSKRGRRYLELWKRSRNDREAFWIEAAAELDWDVCPRSALTQDDGGARWFEGARLNISRNALDRHVDSGRGEDAALIFDSAMTGEVRRFSFRELRDRTAEFAGVLRQQGVDRGDRVIVYMPMIPEAIIAMLACARIGAVHSVVFGGFAATELATRIDDTGAKIIVTASGGLEPGKQVDYVRIVRAALHATNGVSTVVLKQRPGFPAVPVHENCEDVANWVDWDTAVGLVEPVPPVAVAATDPLYILYTSGTTGAPKGVIRDSGGYGVALAWSMRHIYGVGRGDVFWTASDVGWVVGHSYIVYAPLIVGATTMLYEGKPVGTPDAGTLWRIVEQHRVKVLFTAPTAIRAIHRVDPDLELLSEYDTSSLRSLFLAGERLDSETYHWIHEGLGVPVVDHWWQTETGWPITANPLGYEALPVKIGSSTVPTAGFQVVILDSKGHRVEAGTEGNIALELPLPPGTLVGIWDAPERFHDGYLTAFPGYYATGDAGFVDEEGYVFVTGRTDDVINVAGHRLSTGALEDVIGQHQGIAECAVIGIKDELRGQRAMAFVTLKAGELISDGRLCDDLVALVRREIGPVAAFRDVVVLDQLPKTRSGKILRKTLRQIVDGEPYTVPATVEDITAIDAVVKHLTASERLPSGPS